MARRKTSKRRSRRSHATRGTVNRRMKKIRARVKKDMLLLKKLGKKLLHLK